MHSRRSRLFDVFDTKYNYKARLFVQYLGNLPNLPKEVLSFVKY